MCMRRCSILLDICKAFGVEGDMQKIDMGSQDFAGRGRGPRLVVDDGPYDSNCGTATDTTGP